MGEVTSATKSAIVKDSKRALAHGDRAATSEGYSVVAKSEHPVPDLAKVELPLVVQATGAVEGSELDTGSRTGGSVTSRFNMDQIVIVKRYRACSSGAARSIHLEEESAFLSGARHGIGGTKVDGGNLLKAVVGRGNEDPVDIKGRDLSSVPGEEIGRAAVEDILHLREVKGVVPVIHPAAVENNFAGTLGTGGEETQVSSVDNPVPGELRLIAPDVKGAGAELGDLARVNLAVDLQDVVGCVNQRLPGAVAVRAKVEVGVDRRSIASLDETTAPDDDVLELPVCALMDVATHAERVEIQVRSQRGRVRRGVEDLGAVVESQHRTIKSGRRGVNVVGWSPALGDRLETESAVILDELVVEAADDPGIDHVVVHQAGSIVGQEQRAVRIAGDRPQNARSIGVHHHGGDLQGPATTPGDVAG